MSSKRSNLVSVGRVTGVFGIKGWVKVKSFTDPEENIVNYSPWWLKTRHGVKPIEVDSYNFRSQGLVVHFKGVDDRDLAAEYSRVDIAVEKDQLPDLGDGDYYWHQLVGLIVVSSFNGKKYIFGTVKELIETGANDVIVVQSTVDSMDDRERLIPYVPDVYVEKICLNSKEIQVSWDPEF